MQIKAPALNDKLTRLLMTKMLHFNKSAQRTAIMNYVYFLYKTKQKPHSNRLICMSFFSL